MQHDQSMTASKTCYRGVFGIVVAAVASLCMHTAAAAQISSATAQTLTTAISPTSEKTELARAMKIVGPGPGDGTCSQCHAPEYDTWRETRHFKSFTMRHKSKEARAILHNLGEKSMKRSMYCRQCHYTSIAKGDKLRPKWGVSCESCHSPAQDWLETHQKRGGDPQADNLKWGRGKNQPKDKRAARLSAAQKKGMIHSEMLYDLATNCYGCHTVPNETLVNKGKHKAGSDFDLVAWSQGEIRHNFARSAGAPDNPTNRMATPEQLRRLYVVGAMVDLELSLRNLANGQQTGGDFHTAMTERVKKAKAKVDAILKAVDIPELSNALAMPPDDLQTASRTFVNTYDGTTLAGLDGLIPKKTKGKAFTR